MRSVCDRVLKASDGTHLHYRIHQPSEERPPTILFIHGLGSNWTRWKCLAETGLFQQYRLIIPDLRGHGDSVTRNRIGIDHFATDLEAVLKQERGDRPVIVGHCLGANIAVRLWERNPESLQALVLIEPFMTQRLRKTWRIFRGIQSLVVGVFEGAVRTLNRFGLKRKHFRRIDFSIYDDWVRPRLTSFFSVIWLMGPWTDFQCMPVASYLASYRVLFDYLPPWGKIQIPTLVLVASRGGVLDHESESQTSDRPGFERVEIEGSHFLLTDSRERVTQSIQAFIKRF